MTYSEDTAVSGEEYTSTGTDENAILIEAGTVTLDQITVDRTSADSTGGDSASFYGVGAAILATGGEADIAGAQITTDARGGAGTGTAFEDAQVNTGSQTTGGMGGMGGNMPPDMPDGVMDNGGTPPEMPLGGMDNGGTPLSPLS